MILLTSVLELIRIFITNRLPINVCLLLKLRLNFNVLIYDFKYILRKYINISARLILLGANYASDQNISCINENSNKSSCDYDMVFFRNPGGNKNYWIIVNIY